MIGLLNIVSAFIAEQINCSQVVVKSGLHHPERESQETKNKGNRPNMMFNHDKRAVIRTLQQKLKKNFDLSVYDVKSIC